jgi:deoxyribonuclease-4
MENSSHTKFGPSGNSAGFYAEGFKRTVEAPAWLHKRGLTAFEYSFGRGVKMKSETAQEIGAKFKEYDIEISAHAPYYINFANTNADKIGNSVNYVMQTANKLKELGGRRIVIHPASVGETERGVALNLAIDNMKKLVDVIYESKMDKMLYCPETMGKINQIGDYKEISQICKIDSVFIPAVDFGHQNARTHGGLKTERDYDDIIKYMLDEIGYEKVNQMHIHFSKIEYGKGGEVRHLTFSDKVYGPEFAPLAEVIKKHNLNPYIICESEGTQAEDAAEMMQIFRSV